MRKIRRSSFLIGVMISLVAAHANAGDWGQFLGPNRNGVSTETGLINAWPAAGPKIVWRTPLGVSMSGVAVAEGAAFTMFQDETSQYVVCLNAADGKERWRTSVAPSMKMRWATVLARHQQLPRGMCLPSPVKEFWWP